MKRPGTVPVPGRFVFAPGRGEQPGAAGWWVAAEGGGGSEPSEISEISEESPLPPVDQGHHLS